MRRSIRPKLVPEWVRNIRTEKEWIDNIYIYSVLLGNGLVSKKTYLDYLGLDEEVNPS